MLAGKKSHRFGIVTLLVLALISLVQATDFTWDGNFSNLWDRESSSHRTNWDHQGMNNPIPNANDNVYFGGSTPEHTIDLNGNRSVLSADFGCTSDCNADINGDGKTDLLDMSILCNVWLCGAGI